MKNAVVMILQKKKRKRILKSRIQKQLKFCIVDDDFISRDQAVEIELNLSAAKKVVSNVAKQNFT